MLKTVCEFGPVFRHNLIQVELVIKDNNNCIDWPLLQCVPGIELSTAHHYKRVKRSYFVQL